MSEVIMNEKLWVEEKLESLTLGKRPSETLGRLARYYNAQGFEKREIPKLLENFILRCEPTTNIHRWQDVVGAQAKHADKYPLIYVEGVRITKGELDAIKQLDGKNRQRLMFTILCLAKYGNAINPNNNNWVNQTSRDIFLMANITITNARQALMINDLWRAGYIQYSRVVDNVNFAVNIVEEAGDAELFVTDFRNLGNQYLRLIGESCLECEQCGIVLRRASNAQRYCKRCAADINRASAAKERKEKSAD